MEGYVDEFGVHDSRGTANLNDSMKRLMLREAKPPAVSLSSPTSPSLPIPLDSESPVLSSLSSTNSLVCVEKGDFTEHVDQFLIEALQNPRERLSILRMEQDIQKFILDPTREQLEFIQLPTSYLRLAAHRVAQHYSLHSMVLFDNSFPDGTGSRIIVRKNSDSHYHPIRLADIPLSLQSSENHAVKFAIKKRPQKRSQSANNLMSQALESNNSKSVEVRKEEYNRARARIFSPSSSIITAGVKSEGEINPTHGPVGFLKVEEKNYLRGSEMSSGHSLLEPESVTNRPNINWPDELGATRHRPSARVAIFRDRDVDSKDPDYDRSYEKYTQAFDPGFGFNGGPCTFQPIYAPMLNYRTEFPQLGTSQRPQLPVEHHSQQLQQHHFPGLWSNTPLIGYNRPDAVIAPPSSNNVRAHSPPIYFHSNPYLCQRPLMPFIHSHDHPFPYAQMDWGMKGSWMLLVRMEELQYFRGKFFAVYSKLQPSPF